MATLIGLFQRGSSYDLCDTLPVEHLMRPQYKNGEFVTSLGRCTRRKAKARGTINERKFLDVGFFLHCSRSV